MLIVILFRRFEGYGFVSIGTIMIFYVVNLIFAKIAIAPVKNRNMYAD